MLIYHPAFDIYHCAFRLLRLLEALPREDYSIERLRILDFYLLFPSTLKEVSFPRDAVRYRKQLVGPINRYEDIHDPRRIFARLESFQLAALRHLAARSFIEPEKFAHRQIYRTVMLVPPTLAAAMQDANQTESKMIELLTGPFRQIDLYGKSGLKARTQLFEHRYDAV